MICNFLTAELPRNVTIQLYKDLTISFDSLNDIDCDVIVSTFKLPEFKDKETIIIEHYPGTQDLARIESVIDKIVEDKINSNDLL